MNRTILLGGPGAGKTTELIREVERALARGVAPNRIAYVAFTNAAADEAKARTCTKFGLQPNDLPHFRTLHSLCFRELGLNRKEVVGEEHLAEVGELTGELFTGDTTNEGPAAGRNADPLLTVEQYARATRVSLEEGWRNHGGEIEWYRLKRFSDAYNMYKRDAGLLDFTDMLERYADSDTPPVNVDTAIVDEAQDFSLLQWHAAERAFRGCKDFFAGGDDDQAIHNWSGASEIHFRNLKGTLRILPLSHRLPTEIFNLSQEIVRRIGQRVPKDQRAKRTGGEVTWVASPEEVDVSKGTWLLLARTRAQLVELAELARSQGVIYSVKGQSSVVAAHVRAIVAYEELRAGKRVEHDAAVDAMRAVGVKSDHLVEGRTYTAAELSFDVGPIWHDALIRIPLETREYYLSCMRRGEDLRKPPRVRVETIHGAKGAEAERVLLLTDLTYRTARGAESDPDSEERVLYVGLTRASEALHLVAPRGAYAYRF